MSISSTTRKAGPYTGNGITTVFPFTFKVFQASDLLVVSTDLYGVETDLTLTTDYSVSLNANQDSNPGGTITCVTPPTSGYLITLTSAVQELQPVVLTNAGGFYPSVINDALDRLTIFCQQLSEQVGRAIKISISSSGSTDPDTVLATIASEAAIVQSTYNSFVGTYYGALSADPALDPLGHTPTYGDLYFNTTSQTMRVYTSTGWATTAQATPVTYTTQTFNGTGAQTAFTLSSAPASLASTEVYIAGVCQRPTTDFTLSGTTLTFTTAPAAGTNNIFVRWTAAMTVGTPNDGSVTTVKLQDKAVTYGKIQDITASQRLLGRNTAGAGVTEEVTLSQLLDWIGSAARGDILYRGAAAWARLAAGTAGQKLQTGGAGADPTWANGLVQMSMVAVSGTAVDFTNIPSWAKRITIMFKGISTSGTAELLVKLGISTGIVSTGYASSASTQAGTVTSSTIGFIVTSSGAASDSTSGQMIISAFGGNVFVESSVVKVATNAIRHGAGEVSLSDALTQLRITTTNGTDTFDAGSVNVMYEG